MPIIKQNDYVDVIYDTICGFTLEEVIEILEKYRDKRLIPIDWIENWSKQFYKYINGTKYYMGDGYDSVWDVIDEWRKENDKR